MLRSARFVSLVLATVVALVSFTGSSALAVSAPTITRVSPTAGPLKQTVIVLKGRNLNGASAVRFGRAAGTIVEQVSATEVKVRTPKGMRAGRVQVRVKTRGGWSPATAKIGFTFVAAPALTKSSPARGVYTGGQKVTLSGRNLALASKVTFGTAAARIISRKATSMVVTAPVGVLGAAAVRVTTPGGRSRGITFTYVRPAARAAKAITPAAGTFQPAAVEWVTGGYDIDTGRANPWVVSLPPGAALPVVGKGFLVKPGTAAFPTGLAGTVQDIAVQADDSIRVTVTPADLEKSLDKLVVDYSGPLADRGAGLRSQAETAVEWKIGGAALLCRDQQGRTVAFGGEFTSRVTDVDVSGHVELGRLFRKPTMDASYTAEVRTAGKFHGELASTCNLKQAWANANKKIFPLGTTGLTVSIAPALQFTISAKGTLSMLDRTRTTYAVNAELGKLPRFTKTSRSVESTFGGASTFEATLSGGVQVQFGLLDRAGVDSTIMLGLALSVEAGENVCFTGKIVLKLSVSLFLDAWVVRWESPALTAQFDLKTLLRLCVLPDPTLPPMNEPAITSTRLPDAQIGTPYRASLETADGRAGTWSIVRFALPAGLSLDAATGLITGTPTGPVGDNPLIVDFKDAAGQVATTTVRIRVQPSSGIGGGDIQVTLRWAGPADLDLHLTDPAAEEIYYAHRQSASGGTLDHDANANCNGPLDDDNPVENVFWPPRSAPSGTYTTWVKVYKECAGSLDWELTVRRNGRVIVSQTGTGTSPAYTFTLGAGAAVQTATERVTARRYPAK